MPSATKHRVFGMPFASIYPLYVQKAEKKGRTKEEVDQVLRWLTGYTQKGLEAQIAKETDLETFLAKAPKPNPSRKLITGVICGMRVEEIEDPTMQEIRYMDKLVDELARGKAMDAVLRKTPGAGAGARPVRAKKAARAGRAEKTSERSGTRAAARSAAARSGSHSGSRPRAG